MKKFKFRYENILKIKKNRVEKIKNRLGELSYELSVFQKSLDETILERNVFFGKTNNLLIKGCSADKLRDINNFSSFYRKKIDDNKYKIAEIEKEINITKDELIEAVKEEKTMGKLKEHEFENFKKVIEKNENKVTEEIVNYSNFKNRR